MKLRSTKVEDTIQCAERFPYATAVSNSSAFHFITPGIFCCLHYLFAAQSIVPAAK